MSDQIRDAVWKDSKSRGVTRLVLLAVADLARDDGGVWAPNIRQLQAMTGETDASVLRALEDLDLDGEIRYRSDGRSGIWSVRVLLGATK